MDRDVDANYGGCPGGSAFNPEPSGRFSSNTLSRVAWEVSKRIAGGCPFSLFLDFDGTLVPISSDPAAPRLDSKTRDILRRISRRPTCIPTVISGRAIDDLYPRIRLDELLYAGNHGLEIRGRQVNFEEPSASAQRNRLARLAGDLAMQLQVVPGALVEYKGLSASVHYRRVAGDDLHLVDEAVRSSVARAGSDFRLNTGKKVFEIMPRTSWHKGVAAQWINRHFAVEEHRSIYFGDDTTDENAFCSLRQAITVNIGSAGFTRAGYQLPDPETVQEFLSWLADFLDRNDARNGEISGRNS